MPAMRALQLCNRCANGQSLLLRRVAVLNLMAVLLSAHNAVCYFIQ